jgi:hypothetical protein
MNTMATTASTNTILAIDLGKYKSVNCAYEQATGEVRFTTSDTSRDGAGARAPHRGDGGGVSP